MMLSGTARIPGIVSVYPQSNASRFFLLTLYHFPSNHSYTRIFIYRGKAKVCIHQTFLAIGSTSQAKSLFLTDRFSLAESEDQ